MSGPEFPTPDQFLGGIPTMFEPSSQQLQAIDTWVVDDLYYPGYKKFLKLFKCQGFLINLAMSTIVDLLGNVVNWFLKF